MALNLTATLRDAVDGPGLDTVVGEDPAAFDLAALSARVRRRRRARATTRSALGVAAAGAVALAGVQASGHGLGGRGAETAVAPPTAALAALCGRDVSGLPAAGSARLVPTGLVVTSTGAVAGGSDSGSGTGSAVRDLGTLAGRTLTVGIVERLTGSGTGQAGEAPTVTQGDLVLTQGSTVVAVGRAEAADRGVTYLHGFDADDGTTQVVMVAAADLAPCPTGPTGAGSPDRVPAGTYAVQYVTPAAESGAGLERSAAGPWAVTLLDAPSPPVDLPDGYPAGEVPVVDGTLLSATASGDGWTARVAVDGDDGLARAKAALAGAGAGVAPADPPLQVVDGPAATSGDPAMATQIATLVGMRVAQSNSVDTARQAYDELRASDADGDAIAVAARELATAQQQLSETEAKLAAARQKAGQTVGGYSFAVSSSVEATTRSWTVSVSQDTQDGRTVLTYVLSRR